MALYVGGKRYRKPSTGRTIGQYLKAKLQRQGKIKDVSDRAPETIGQRLVRERAEVAAATVAATQGPQPSGTFVEAYYSPTEKRTVLPTATYSPQQYFTPAQQDTSSVRTEAASRGFYATMGANIGRPDQPVGVSYDFDKPAQPTPAEPEQKPLTEGERRRSLYKKTSIAGRAREAVVSFVKGGGAFVEKQQTKLQQQALAKAETLEEKKGGFQNLNFYQKVDVKSRRAEAAVFGFLAGGGRYAQREPEQLIQEGVVNYFGGRAAGAVITGTQNFFARKAAEKTISRTGSVLLGVKAGQRSLFASKVAEAAIVGGGAYLGYKSDPERFAGSLPSAVIFGAGYQKGASIVGGGFKVSKPSVETIKLTTTAGKGRLTQVAGLKGKAQVQFFGKTTTETFTGKSVITGVQNPSDKSAFLLRTFESGRVSVKGKPFFLQSSKGVGGIDLKTGFGAVKSGGKTTYFQSKEAASLLTVGKGKQSFTINKNFAQVFKSQRTSAIGESATVTITGKKSSVYGGASAGSRTRIKISEVRQKGPFTIRTDEGLTSRVTTKSLKGYGLVTTKQQRALIISEGKKVLFRVGLESKTYKPATVTTKPRTNKVFQSDFVKATKKNINQRYYETQVKQQRLLLESKTRTTPKTKNVLLKTVPVGKTIKGFSLGTRTVPTFFISPQLKPRATTSPVSKTSSIGASRFKTPLLSSNFLQSRTPTQNLRLYNEVGLRTRTGQATITTRTTTPLTPSASVPAGPPSAPFLGGLSVPLQGGGMGKTYRPSVKRGLKYRYTTSLFGGFTGAKTKRKKATGFIGLEVRGK